MSATTIYMLKKDDNIDDIFNFIKSKTDQITLIKNQFSQNKYPDYNFYSVINGWFNTGLGTYDIVEEPIDNILDKISDINQEDYENGKRNIDLMYLEDLEFWSILCQSIYNKFNSEFGIFWSFIAGEFDFEKCEKLNSLNTSKYSLDNEEFLMEELYRLKENQILYFKKQQKTMKQIGT